MSALLLSPCCASLRALMQICDIQSTSINYLYCDCAGEDLKHVKGLQPQAAAEEKPPSPVERLLKSYFAFVQEVSADDPVMQLTFWRVR